MKQLLPSKGVLSLIILFLSLFGLSSYTLAQVNQMTLGISNDTYTEITGGTVLGSSSSDDQYFVDPAAPLGGSTKTGPGFDIGFNFTINGNTFDRFGVNNNGWMAFGKSTLTPSVDMNTTSGYTPLSSSATNVPDYLRTRVAGVGRDLQGQAGSELSYLLTGSAPNRVLVIQFKNYRKYNATGDAFNFQIRLYETSNTVKVVYGSFTANSTSTTVQVGLGGTVNTDFNNVQNGSDWTTSLTNGSTNSSSCTLVNGNTPASGLTFTWTAAGAMAYTSSTTMQDTSIVYRGSTNQKILGVKVVMTGALTPLNVTALTLNANGTTSVNDIQNAKVFFTGASPNFDTTVQFGSTYAAPTTTNFTITGSQVLAGGANYFWVTYDVKANAPINNHVDAECPSLTISGTTGTVVPTVTAPAGYRLIQEINFGGGLAGSGGYYFANSIATEAPSHPVYMWIDPSTHTEVTSWNTSGDDGVTAAIPIGFSFTFFGTPYTDVYLCANGWVTFTDPAPLSTTVRRTPVAIPTVGGIENYITAALCDLDVRTTTYSDAHVYTGGDVTKFVITFLHAHKYGSTSDYISFQFILWANGNVEIQYNDLESSIPPPVSITNASTTGIENADGTLGIQYRFNGNGAPIFGSPMAIMFGTNASNLPVELTSFTAISSGRNVNLNWETKSELNTSKFVVERTSDAINWVPVGTVSASINSTTAKKYSLTDYKLNQGNYTYRLKIVDVDGSFKYSQTTEASVEVPKNFELSQNYPNPFNPSTRIDYSVAADSRVMIELYSITGEKVAELVNKEHTAGYYTLDVNSSSIGKNLASGVYIYRMTATGLKNNASFVNVKKMLMLK